MRNTEAAAVVRRLAERVHSARGRALLIGGSVRDRLLGVASTDFDVEVYGLPPERVEALARAIGEVHEVGKAFGVLEIRFLDASTLHLSLPRRESKVAPGHRGFAVDTDLSLSPAEAARRRDFTINAIAEDPLTGEIIDPFCGREDLRQKVLRVVDATTFADDPLRVLRGAVFAAQFGLQVDEESDAVIRRATPSLRELPRERVQEEWRKLLFRPSAPSAGLQLLMAWGVFAVLHPDFQLLPKTPQSPRWHPEGDVWTHTIRAVDEAVAVLTRGVSENLSPLPEDDRWCVLLATLCHDLGKAVTTVWLREAWRAPGHDAAGVEPTRKFLRSLAASTRTVEVVVRLVREHLRPLLFFQTAERREAVPDRAIRDLARRLQPGTIFLLTLVADADHRGRGPFCDERGRAVPPPAAAAGERLRERAGSLDVLHGPPAPVLRGADLVALGLKPGPEFGAILRQAEELRDDRGETRESLLSRLTGADSLDEALTRLGH